MRRFRCISKAVIDKEHLCVGVFEVLWSPRETYGMAASWDHFPLYANG